MSDCTTLLSCDDSPLAIASSTAGFYTTLVALAVAYYAFHETFVKAPTSFTAFRMDVSLFQLQLTHLEADLKHQFTDEGDSNDNTDPGVRAIHEAIYEGRQIHKKAHNVVQLVDGTMSEAIKHSRFSWTRMRAGFGWWWSQNAAASELTMQLQAHRGHLSFSERRLTRRYITLAHRDINVIRHEMFNLLSGLSRPTTQASYGSQ